MNNTSRTLQRMNGLALALLAGASWAGRPMTVDDANVAEVAGGQVETWYARQSDRSHHWNAALGVGVYDGVELGLAHVRNQTLREDTNALQLKLRLTPSVEGGCNFGAVLGAAHTNHGAGRTDYVNGLFSCNLESATWHFNLGANRAEGGPTLKTWGVAAEKELGPVTAHIEYFGVQHSGPTVQIGLRTELAKNVQLDGTLGRSDRRAIFSVGLRFGF